MRGGLLRKTPIAARTREWWFYQFLGEAARISGQIRLLTAQPERESHDGGQRISWRAVNPSDYRRVWREA
jgi:hypothetical protein